MRVRIRAHLMTLPAAGGGRASGGFWEPIPPTGERRVETSFENVPRGVFGHWLRVMIVIVSKAVVYRQTYRMWCYLRIAERDGLGEMRRHRTSCGRCGREAKLIHVRQWEIAVTA